MSEVDYQLALLLQHKFEKETEYLKQDTYLADSEFAKSLQDQFRRENEVDVIGKNLSYASKGKKTASDSKSLVDPSWEVIDPTPDVHMLFMTFNESFFWNKLLAVCVSWSKRMTSCAGICSYQGRGGMCSITLSEPLLKLRPRKDLVETLLHEMIHAYLFVTNNNRDRDGHGLEFQKHMFRINAETGTNITIYHDFYDEVRLYKTHWWKCDGPCQHRHPYYGTVKRATNRAPGPNDRWWAEHSRSCGGNFIKIKEPVKEKKIKKGDSPTSNKIFGTAGTDIRKFFSPTKSESHTSPNTSLKTKGRSTATSTIVTNKKNAQVSSEMGKVISKVGNIFGFTQLNNESDSSSNYQPTVFNKNNNVSNKSVRAEQINVKTDTGRVLNVTAVNSLSSNFDYNTVRDAWLNKFPHSNNSVKRTSSQEDNGPKQKISKISTTNASGSNQANCPICDKTCDFNDLNDHLDKCLENKDTKECIICGKEVTKDMYENHVTSCSSEIFDDDIEVIETEKNPHIVSNPEELQLCEVCDEMVASDEYELHIGECLNRMYDRLDDKYSNKMVNCVACSTKVLKEDLNSHLENCPNLSRIFDDDNAPLEGQQL